MTGSEPRGDELESARFLQSMLEALPQYVVRLDDEDRIRYASRLPPGLTWEQVLGREVLDFVAPEYREVHRQAITAARREGGEHAYLVKAAGPDGQDAYYETRAIGVDEGSQRRIVYLVASDVTEHLARAEALRDSEEKLRLAVEASGIGLWSWDFETGAFDWSTRMGAITGQPGSLGAQQYVERCVHPQDRALVQAEMQAARRDGSARFPVHRIVRPDGEVRWVAPFGQVTRAPDGRPLRMRGGTLDITAQRQTEERLRQMQKLEAIGGLTAGVAHNFNNVLAVILPAIETALRDPAFADESVTRKRLEDAGEAARRAANLVSQLMTSAGQRVSAEHGPVDVHGLLRGVVSMCRQTFDRCFAIELRCDAVPPAVRGDAGALEQVFLNLMMNARDALAESRRSAPCIEVELQLSEGTGEGTQEVRVVVRDNGPGMSEEVQARLYEPFFTTKPPGQGTGLGLATSLATVQSHRGRLEIRSQPGRGTTCEVVLPCASGVAVLQGTDSAPTPRLARRASILIVDDEPAIRGVVRQVLEAVGHQVAAAESAEHAVEVLSAGFVPQLVLLDRSMPGWPVRRAIAALRDHVNGAPIVFFTGQSVPDDEAALVDGVLHKPMSVDELHYAIARWLRG